MTSSIYTKNLPNSRESPHYSNLVLNLILVSLNTQQELSLNLYAKLFNLQDTCKDLKLAFDETVLIENFSPFHMPH